MRALTAVGSLALLIPTAAAADTVGPPYVAAGGAGSCSPSTQTWMMACDAHASAEVSGAVTLSAFTRTAYEGGLPGSGTATGNADIYTEHDRDFDAESLTYTVRLHVDEASAERSGGILSREEAAVRIWAYVVPENCFCEGGASVTLVSSANGPASIADQDIEIPVEVTGEFDVIPAGTTFIQFFFEAKAGVSLDTGLARAQATFTVTGIDVS